MCVRAVLVAGSGPTYPMLFKMESAHEELADLGGERAYAVNTLEFLGDENGRVRALRVVDVRGPETGFEPIEGGEREIPAQLVTLAMGFVGPERGRTRSSAKAPTPGSVLGLFVVADHSASIMHGY